MAHLTIAQCAKRMFTNPTRPISASNLHIYPASCPASPEAVRIPGVGFRAQAATLGLRPLVVASSYSTRVAVLVYNDNSDQHEFWLTSERYSATTDRHCRLLLDAWRGFAPAQSVANLYQFNVSAFGHRCFTGHMSEAVRDVWSKTFPGIVAKGVHEKTRIAHLQNALRNIEYNIRLVTNDLPLPAIEKVNGSLAQLHECIEMRAQLLELGTLPVPQLRAAVNGLLALERDDSTERG